MAENLKQIHGPSLVEAGFMLVPIKKGEKHPKTKEWPKIRATLKDVNEWAQSRYYGGLGALGQFSPGVDIDVYDPEIVDKISAWCFANIGRAPIRIGNAPRILIPYDAPLGGIGPDNSKKYESPDGNLHQIEIKATGQQWVAYGIHPGTGNPYKWVDGDGAEVELHSYNREFLPTLTGEKIQELFKYFESIAPSDWVIKSKGRARNRVGGVTRDGLLEDAQAFENYKPPLNLDADRIRSMLTKLDPDGTVNGKGWRTVGMALFHQFEGSQDGLELFIEWSSRSSEYDYDEIAARWPSWAAKSYGGNPVTAATIVQMYNEVTKKEDDPTLRLKGRRLSDWEARFVLVEQPDGTEVHDAGSPIHKAPRRLLRAFREHNSGYLHRHLSPEGEVKTVPMVEAWKDSLKTRHYAGYTYQPGKPRFCVRESVYGDDSMYVNTFYFPPHPEDDEGETKPFFDFLKHLFPEPKEMGWITTWLARMVQNPGVRSFVTPINITPITGTGRGILFEILRNLVGGHNTHDVSKDDMEGRFNGFLDKCIIAVVQEIKATTGGHKYQMWERMKSLLADTTANIQAKGENSYTSRIYANFMMFSNNIDALPIQDVNERRIYAMRGASRPISPAEIDKIVKWKDEPLNIAALFHFLKNKVVVDENKFKRAPSSETKIQMVRAALGTSGADLSGWLADEAPKVFDYDFAMESLERYSEDLASVGISRDAFRRALADKGFHSAQIRVDQGRRVYVYYRPQDVGPGIGAKALRALMNTPKVPKDFLT